MTITRHSVVLMDELQPHVGSGFRVVEAKVGHKWVRVRDAARAKFSPTNFKRIKRKDWDTIVTKSRYYFDRNGSLK